MNNDNDTPTAWTVDAIINDNILAERVHRYKLRQYHIQDAENHVSDYLKRYDLPADEYIDLFDLEGLAEAFEDDHECNIADNDQWRNLISDHARNIKNAVENGTLERTAKLAKFLDTVFGV